MSLGCCVMVPTEDPPSPKKCLIPPSNPQSAQEWRPHGDSDFSETRRPERLGDSGLDHSIDLSPLVDVLLTHYVGVDEEVSVAHTEVLLTGSTFETFQVIHFVFHPHCHLVGTDPLVTGRAETVLAKKPGGKTERKAKKTLADTKLAERTWGWVPYGRLTSNLSGNQEEAGLGKLAGSFLKGRGFSRRRLQPMGICVWHNLPLFLAFLALGCPGAPCLWGRALAEVIWIKRWGMYCVSPPGGTFILEGELE